MSISIILYNCCGQIINQNKYWSHLLSKEHELNNKLASIYEEEDNKINNKSRKIINRIYKKNEYINELKKNILNYKKQFWFKDLRHINTLKYDFGILDENGSLKYLIEYNGEQHYKFIKHIHKYYENYEVMKIRDVLKQEYCVKNNIPLFVIKFNENIEEKLYAIIKQ